MFPLRERSKKLWEFLNDQRVVAVIAIGILVALTLAGNLIDLR